MLLAALALPASARAAEPYFDVRDQRAGGRAGAATRALERRLGPQARRRRRPVTRTPRVVARLDGTLSGPAEGAAAPIALRYVRENLAALGLDAADLDTLAAARARPGRRPAGALAPGDRRHRAADSELRVNVTDDGRVLSVLGSPAPALPTDTTPDLTAGEAARAVQDDVGVHRRWCASVPASARSATTTARPPSSRCSPSGSPGASPTVRPRTRSTT